MSESPKEMPREILFLVNWLIKGILLSENKHPGEAVGYSTLTVGKGGRLGDEHLSLKHHLWI